MAVSMDQWLYAVPLGVGATAIMDVLAVALQRLAGVAPPNYALVGRWVGYMFRGRFRHEAIAAAPALPTERSVGWATHYLTGIAFAGVLLAIWGADWLRQPTAGPALIVGLGSVAAPFLLMQPGMGAGIAASRTPRPAAARLRSLLNHGLFALGLYAAGWALHALLAF